MHGIIKTFALASMLTITPSVSLAQDAQCENNETMRCAQSVDLDTKVEGIMDVSQNRTNVFKIVVTEAGIYELRTFKEVKYPQYSLTVTKDGAEKPILRRLFNARERIERFTINSPGTYFVTFFNYPGSGKPHMFDFTLAKAKRRT